MAEINPNLWGITDPGEYAAVDEQGKPIVVNIQQHGWSSYGVEGNEQARQQWEGLRKIGPGSQELFNSLQELKSAANRGVAPAPNLVTQEALDRAGDFGIDTQLFASGGSTGPSGKTGGPTRPDRELTMGLTTVQGPSINFREGLTEDQKKGVTGLLTSRQGRWSETDKKNWNYATNNAVPTGAQLITSPSGLSGLTEEQIWRQPGTNRIYRLPGGSPPSQGRLPGESVVDYTNRVAGPNGSETDAATGTSESIRAQIAQEIKNELLPGGKMPDAPPTAEERIRLRRESGIISDEQDLADLRSEYRLAQEEMRVFKSRAGQGVTEGGRIGAVSEAERNASFRIEGLALREQALVERINSKNAFINQVIQDQQTDYANALQAWNTEFGINTKVNELVNAHLDDIQKDAISTVTTISNLMKDADVPYDQWPAEMRQQTEIASMQLGLPKELFKTAFSNLREDEKIHQVFTRPNAEGGEDVYVVTQGSQGIGLMRLGGIPGGVASMEAPKTIETPSGFIQWDASTGDWVPLTVGGEPVGTEDTAKAEARKEKITTQAEIVTSAVDEALRLLPSTSYLGAVGRVAASKIPGTSSSNFAATIDTIKANLGFDTLQAMRESSPTGGALGAVSDREIGLLQSTVASLDIAQSDEQLAKNLNAVKTHYQNWKNAVSQASEQTARGNTASAISEAMRTYGPEAIIAGLRSKPGATGTLIDVSRALGISDAEYASKAIELGKDVGKVWEWMMTKVNPKAEGGTKAAEIISFDLGGRKVAASKKVATALKKADIEFYRATGRHIIVNEALRSHERQKDLYDKFKSGKGGRAAPPGKSFHETGNAVDVQNWQEAQPFLRKYGLINALADDRNHFSIGEFNA